MLTMLHLRTPAGVFLHSLPVINANETSPYVVSNIEGLGPVKAEISSSTYAPLDGGVYQSSRVGYRNIVISVQYRPDYSAGATTQSLRRDLYAFFPPERPVRLHFVDSEFPEVYIDGYVESHEPTIFSKDPEVSISILCMDPYFSEKTETVLNGTAGTNLVKPYSGTAPTGFRFLMTLSQNTGQYTLSNGLDVPIVHSRGLTTGERAQISTNRGDKYAMYLRSGTWTNDLQQITSGTLSMELNNQVPYFLMTMLGGTGNAYTLTFTTKYIGL